MSSDYEAITQDNIRRRGEEFDDIGNFLAGKLYGDRAHFIYELLQNAEDALDLRRQRDPGVDFSGEVTFRLYSNHLEVSHYGKLFDEEDVKGVCDVFRGTKAERLDQIGTFGIGFKSVYAFTRSPEIHSGDEHFVIRNFIRPHAVEPRPLQDPLQTLCYFPFDHPDFGEFDALELIQSKLKSLGPRSLLFLHNVKSLLWEVEGAGSGFYMREHRSSESGGALVHIIGEGTNQHDTEEKWLAVHRDVNHPSRPGKLPVKVAYSIEADKDGRSIAALHRSALTAFFPTARETGLGFLIHGPFAATPARDNIETDSPWNDSLLNELATLVSDSLSVCRRHGFLTPQFLTVLPIDPESFPEGSPFRPIYEAVLEAFKTQPLIPRVGGSHIKADRAVLGRSQELRELLSPALLTELLGTSAQTRHWVDATVTENRLPKVWQYLRDECDVPVLDGDAFARQITHRFLEARDEKWMVSFFAFLNGQEALWRPQGVYRNPPEGPLRKKAIIRCQDGRHRAPFDSAGEPLVFLPIESKADYHIVHRSIYAQEEAAEFMHRLGLVPPDICTRVLNEIIPLYQDDSEDEAHEEHLSVIATAMDLEDSPRYTAMLSELKTTTWARATDARTGEQSYEAPTELFFRSSELQAFFEGNEDVSFLAEQEELIDWQKLGVRSAPVIHCRGLGTKRNSFVLLCSYHGWHMRGYDGFDPETAVDGLDHALTNITHPRAAYIWNELLPPNMRFLHGRYEQATHQNYDNATAHEGDSVVCKMLKSHAWIPVRSGEFKKPAECTLANLAGELKRNEDLAEVLGVHPDPAKVAEETLESEQNLVAKVGFSPEVATLLVNNKAVLTPEFINTALASHAAGLASQPEFPKRSVPNKARRVGLVRQRAKKANPKTYDKRKRSVRISKPEIPADVWLREMYTNREGTTVCQMCRKAMPFKLPRTGEYYFEAVQIADNFPVEDHCLYLALCPLCAAKYKVLVKRDEDYLKEFIWAIEVAEEQVVPVGTDGSSGTVCFVESHLLDVKTALSECLF